MIGRKFLLSALLLTPNIPDSAGAAEFDRQITWPLCGRITEHPPPPQFKKDLFTTESDPFVIYTISATLIN